MIFSLLLAVVLLGLTGFAIGTVPPLALWRLNESSGANKKSAIPRRLHYFLWSLGIMLFMAGVISETIEARKDPLGIFFTYSVICIAFLIGSLYSINELERELKDAESAIKDDDTHSPEHD